MRINAIATTASLLVTLYFMVAAVIFLDELRRAKEISAKAITKALIDSLLWVFAASQLLQFAKTNPY